MINLSKPPLNGSELEVLKKGLNFAPFKKPLNLCMFLSHSAFISSTEEDASTARKHISQILMRAKPPPSNFPPPLRLALKSLSKKEDILILPSDKGRATVTLDKSSYDVKISTMLSDNQTYCETLPLPWKGS